MRPLLLNITGVKSICERQTIDFERLAKSGIFGIFGKTGSGKSTILDSIVLALYGEVISKVDNADFINSNSNTAEVELVFSATSEGVEHKYRVIRTYKFDKMRKKLKQPDVFLWEITGDGEIPIAEGAKLVNSSIQKDIIGLEKDDFLKCIALPQGEFSAFVKMTRGERLKVIGKLFNLRRYGRELYLKVKEKQDELATKEATELGKLSSLENFSLEGFSQIEEDYQSVQKEVLLVKQELQTSMQELSRAKQVAELNKELQDCRQKIVEKSANRSIIDKLEVEIKVFDRAILSKGILQNYDRALGGFGLVKSKLEVATKERESKAQLQKIANERLEKLPELEKNGASLVQKRASITAVELTCKQLAQKSKQIAELREVYRKRNNQIAVVSNTRESALKKISEIDKRLKQFDISTILKELSEGAARAEIDQILKEHLVFLNELNGLMNASNQTHESAVNELIGAQIEKTKSLLIGQKAGVDIVELLDSTVAGLKNNTHLSNEKAKLNAECESNLNLLNTLMEEQARDRVNGEKLNAENEELLAEQKRVLGELEFDEALRVVDRQIAENEATIKSIKLAGERAQSEYNEANENLAKLNGEVAQFESNLNELKQQLSDALERCDLSIDSLREVLAKEADINIARKRVDDYKNELNRLTGRVGEIEAVLKEAPKEYFNLEFFDQKCKNSEQRLAEINKKWGEISKTYEMGLQNKENWCKINNTIKELKEEKSLYDKLIELFKLDKFMEYIADEYLKEVADIAEDRVLELTNGKYGLVYDGDFFVRDYGRGGILRPVAGLSGGETFLVSLSLALALSNQIIKKAVKPINFFFLDEGFGTLDEDLINTVTDSLEKLRQSNLTVGLITHVGELKNRIQSKLYVEGATASHGTIITQSF